MGEVIKLEDIPPRLWEAINRLEQNAQKIKGSTPHYLRERINRLHEWRCRIEDIVFHQRSFSRPRQKKLPAAQGGKLVLVS